MSTPVIEARNLSVHYRLRGQWLNVVRDVSLAVHAGEIHGLVGESGSGKTTLALALMRYLAANARMSAGQVLFEGTDISTYTPTQMRPLWGRRISMIPQDALASLNPAYRVGDQIAEVVRQHEHVSAQAAWARAVDMLGTMRLANPSEVAASFPHQLSGGMQQRVTIAMALVTGPTLLVLDEPTTALDVTTQARILEEVRELIRAEQAAALYVSHDMGTVAQLCDRVTVLYAGEVMESADVHALFGAPLNPYTAALLGALPQRAKDTHGARLPVIGGRAPGLGQRGDACVFAARCPAVLEQCRQERPPLLAFGAQLSRCWRADELAAGTLTIANRPVPSHDPADAPTPTPLLDAANIRKTFIRGGPLARLLRRGTKLVAVDDVNVAVPTRTTVGLVGESGSGKTTLARALVGLLEADGGTITLRDLPIRLRYSQRRPDVLRDIQMVFQNPNDTLNPYRTVGQALRRALRQQRPRARVPGATTKPQKPARARVEALLSAVRLGPEYADRYPSELSGGEKQRVAIARAFAANPSLVVADEPTSSLDVSVQAVVLNLLKDLRAQEGAAYLLISHDLDVIGAMADAIVVMYLGEVVESGPNARVFGTPSHPYTEALLSAIPNVDPSQRTERIRLDGEVPSAAHIPSGCRFHTRCPRKIGPICEQQAPPWQSLPDGHGILCHIPVDVLAAAQTAPVTPPTRDQGLPAVVSAPVLPTAHQEA